MSKRDWGLLLYRVALVGSLLWIGFWVRDIGKTGVAVLVRGDVGTHPSR